MAIVARCLAALRLGSGTGYVESGIRRRRVITRSDLWSSKAHGHLNWTNLSCLDAEGSPLSGRMRLAYIERG